MKYTSFNKTKKPLRKGLTLIELVITIVIVGVLSLVIYPVINSSIDVYVRVQDSYDFSQDAIDFFAFLDTLFKDNCTVTAINSAQLGFTSDSENYQVAVSGFPGTPPYSITLTKNGGQARALVNGLAELSAPNRPGLEFVYFDHNQNVTSIASEVVAIRAKLSFMGKSNVHEFRSGWGVLDSNEYIP